MGERQEGQKGLKDAFPFGEKNAFQLDWIFDSRVISAIFRFEMAAHEACKRKIWRQLDSGRGGFEDAKYPNKLDCRRKKIARDIFST